MDDDGRLTRRGLLAGAVGAAAAGMAARAEGTSPEQVRRVAPLTVAVLGDLHFDRPAHHDMEWLAREHPGDVHQVQEYTAITEGWMGRLFAEVRQAAAAHRPAARAVLQLGDLVEGLCGTQALAETQCRDALAFVRDARLGVPFILLKGNHDITGPGAREAFDAVLAPFAAQEAGSPGPGEPAAWRHGDCLFALFDAYRPGGFEQLERTLAARTARHLVVLTHPPFVPFNARSLWHQYSRPQDADQRKRLLDLLGHHRAIVLCGHLHRFGVVARRTEAGPIVQLALSSVLPAPDVRPRQEVSGVARYGPDLVNLEPDFEPRTAAARREALQAEAPFVTHFEYADAPGWAILTVDGDHVRADVYAGLGHAVWKTIDLTACLRTAEG